jgi:choline-sulfatase
MNSGYTRRELLAAAPALLAQHSDPRPNILLFFPDQWRHDWTGFTPRLGVRTPRLDALADRGVRFTNAIVPSPLCAPSRACLASGREYAQCGVPGNRFDYPLEQPTMYQRLRESGYHVMACGKIDLHKKTLDWGLDGRRLLPELGFSDGIDNAGKRDAIISGAQAPKDPYMAMLYELQLARAHVDDFRKRRNYADTYPTPLPDHAYCDNWIGGNGLKLLERAPRGKPWFLAVNFTGPHEPMDITSSMERECRGRSFPRPFGDTQFDDSAHTAIRQNYTAMVENLDGWLGKYIDAVRTRGELDNTLIVVSSDHGEMLGDHGRWGKTVPWQASVGVPLVIAGPGVKHGRTIDAPATILDLTATFLDYGRAGELPAQDSVSMRPLLEGRRKRLRQQVFCGLGQWRTVFDGRYKLVRGFDPNTPAEPGRATAESAHVDLLFDLREDPFESRNMADRTPNIMRVLTRQLRTE